MKNHALFILVLISFFLVHCTTLQFYKEKPPAEVSSQAQKKEYEKLSQTAKTYKNAQLILKDLDLFIASHKNSELVLSAYLLKAKIFSKQKEEEKACKVYHQAVQLPFFYKDQYKAYLASAQCYAKSKNIQKALSVLEALIESPKESLRTKKRAAQDQWHFVKNEEGFELWKIRILSKRIQLSPKHPHRVLWKNKGETLVNQLDSNHLLKISKMPEVYSFFEGLILYRLGLVFWNKKNVKKSSYYFAQALSASLSPKIENQIKSYLTILKSIKKTNPYLIGVILPLSGPQKNLGEKILRGLNIGLYSKEDSPWQMIVMDNKGHPDITKEAFKKLLYKHHVIGMIGGAKSDTASVLAELSSDFGVPSLVFSQKSDLTKNNPYLFQIALTSQNLMSHLTKFLNKEPLNIQQVAILAPRDPYGREYTERFKTAFEEQGGTITHVETYKPKEVNFEKHIKKLLGLDDLETRKEEYEALKEEYLKKYPHLSSRSKKLSPERILPPQFEFQALFIPDSLKAVKKIENYLKYYRVKNMHILGTNLLSQKQISKWSHLRPLVFINMPELTTQILSESLFYNQYQKIFSKVPQFFEQQAYNAATILRTTLESGASDRIQLYKKLQDLTRIQGAFFPLEFSDDRFVLYPLNVFLTERNKIITLDQALAL